MTAEKQRSPNKRVQRTRSSASRHRSPLTRKSLGSQRAIVALFMVGALAFACRTHESRPAPVIVRDPGYLVARPLSWKEDPDHGLRVSVKYTSVGYAFAANRPLLDMNSFILGEARVDSQKDAMGAVRLWLPVTRAGTQSLATWSGQNVGEHLGIFVESRLVQVVGIKSPLTVEGIPVTFQNGEEAKAVLERLKMGGAHG